MRSRTEPGGWQANSVAVRVVGLVDDPQRVGQDDLGPGHPVDVAPRQRRHDHLVAGLRAGRGGGSRGCWLTRWPASTTLPTSPGIAVPGQWPGPLSSVDRRMPSNIVRVSPIAGISIVPISIRGSVVPSSGGGGDGERAAVAASIVGRHASWSCVVGRRRRWSSRSRSWCRRRRRRRARTTADGARRGRRRGRVVAAAAAGDEHARRRDRHAETDASAKVCQRRAVRRAAVQSTSRGGRARPGRCTPGRRCRRSWHR